MFSHLFLPPPLVWHDIISSCLNHQSCPLMVLLTTISPRPHHPATPILLLSLASSVTNDPTCMAHHRPLCRRLGVELSQLCKDIYPNVCEAFKGRPLFSSLSFRPIRKGSKENKKPWFTYNESKSWVWVFRFHFSILSGGKHPIVK